MYLPETGEEIYSSFLGVPILRGGNTLGVLVVQNKARRTYPEEEIEALETTAMLLAEMIASGELQSLAPPGRNIALRRPLALKGTPVADGVGLATLSCTSRASSSNSSLPKIQGGDGAARHR